MVQHVELIKFQYQFSNVDKKIIFQQEMLNALNKIIKFSKKNEIIE